jgi:hypothetical protein
MRAQQEWAGIAIDDTMAAYQKLGGSRLEESGRRVLALARRVVANRGPASVLR